MRTSGPTCAHDLHDWEPLGRDHPIFVWEFWFEAGRFGNQIDMIILGLVLMLLGFVLSIPILWTVGIVVLIVGLVLLVLGRSGRSVGGRAHYW